MIIVHEQQMACRPTTQSLNIFRSQQSMESHPIRLSLFGTMRSCNGHCMHALHTEQHVHVILTVSAAVV